MPYSIPSSVVSTNETDELCSPYTASFPSESTSRKGRPSSSTASCPRRTLRRCEPLIRGAARDIVLTYVQIPENITFDQAASVPTCLATVVTGIWAHGPGASSIDLPAPWEEGGLTQFKGKAALIIGGSSSLGQYGTRLRRDAKVLIPASPPTAIQLAKMQGFSPIITTSSLKHADYLKSLGATDVIDRFLSLEAIAAELPKITGGQSIVYVYDTVADDTTENLAYDVLAPGGGLVVADFHSQAILEEKVKRDGSAKKVAYPFASLQSPGNKELGVELFARLEEWLRTGTIVVSGGDSVLGTWS